MEARHKWSSQMTISNRGWYKLGPTRVMQRTRPFVLHIKETGVCKIVLKRAAFGAKLSPESIYNVVLSATWE